MYTQQNVIAIIPARLSSERLPGKLLLEVGGKPVILHTLESVGKARTVNRVIAAVDHEDLFRAAESAGFEAVMTSADHPSGSDRIAEVASSIEGDAVIVNVQGDEPLISPSVIDLAVEALLNDKGSDISTTCEAIESAREVVSPDVVKVVSDSEGRALYFSRAPIPYPRDEVRKHGSLETALLNDPELCSAFCKHTGLYVFRKDALLKFTALEPSPAEVSERLEQLRALENGLKIRVVEVEDRSIGIDTAEDLERFRKLVEGGEEVRVTA
ncbi:MAG: 3-deoxy-manno-octulosonate cytidylyltransferase [Acidobacteria bacterium]|nr:MAG: 3-deoxy-manno-octulosonate cytidylyltransferase [Acidobacteriota bacterium]REK03124.1 MAG: 3-deoxy-manno-octulosonate cytidylyltransferase [Acidobacteriota bacterium]REK15422.1 MAG: 3-deoxy-manno-octulosonate cytidylyltransferase [Acidobacteriota bacterium]REK42139.1 MAG: 3-deoxy-manno-octulosonate cytidylyltransferase [Acidobacteriota bacterium]